MTSQGSPKLTTRAANRRKRPTQGRLLLEHFMPYRLAVLSNVVATSIASAYERDFGLTMPQWRVLAVLARYPSSSAVEVSERAALDKVAVSRAVQSLVAAGHIERAADRGDRRRHVLNLSPSGRAVYMRVAPRALRYERQLLDALSPAERRTLDRLIARLLERSRELEANGKWKHR
jgi:DNA-binding MarR family transcriptional regulator